MSSRTKAQSITTPNRVFLLFLLLMLMSKAIAQTTSTGNGNVVVGKNLGVINNKVYMGRTSKGQTTSMKLEPSVTFDQHEGFFQQYRATNTAPYVLHNVRFACMVLSVDTVQGDPFFSHVSQRYSVSYLMVPLMGSLPEVPVGHSTTSDCDYELRPGIGLRKAEIEMEVLFNAGVNRKDAIESYPFSGRQTEAQTFAWTDGMSKASPFRVSKNMNRLVIVIPFGGDNRNLAPCPSQDEYYKIITSWIKKLQTSGDKVMVSTMIKGKYDLCGIDPSTYLRDMNVRIRNGAGALRYIVFDVATDPVFSP